MVGNDTQPHEHQTHEVDVVVGSRIKLRRKELNVSQQSLAESVGITFQQIQKYERGTNRVSSSKLYDIAVALKAPISYFFEGLPDPSAGETANPIERAVTLSLSQGQIPETALMMVRMGDDVQRYIKTCVEGLYKLYEEGSIGRTTPEERTTRPSKKSATRLRLEQLARQPIGSVIKFPYGTFKTTRAAHSMVATIGGSTWAEIETTPSGYIVTKISEPRT